MLEHKNKGFRAWKSGKSWLYSAGALALLIGGGIAVTNLPTFTIIAHADSTSMPSGYNQIGSIGSAPLYSTSNTNWSNVQLGVNALAKGQKADYYVGAVNQAGQGQALGWYDGQTTYNGQSFGSLVTADPSDLNTPNYNFVKKAIMDKDGFIDSDNFNYVTSAGQSLAIHNIGEAYEASTGKFVPVGIKVTVNDATYYDSSDSSTPRDVFADGYKLLFGARDDGKGNITMGALVVMNGVVAQDNGGGSEGGGGDGGTGATYGGCTTGIPESLATTITYVNEDTGQELPNNSLSVVKVSDVDASQQAQIGSNALGYMISNPTNLGIDGNALTANGNTVTSSSGLSANSFVTVKTTNSYFVNFTDTWGNNEQGSIIMALFGKNDLSLPAPPNLVKNVLTKTESSTSYPASLSQENAEFKLKNLNTGAYVKASDALSSDLAIKATNGTMSTASDGNLLWTAGTDGKIGVKNLPSVDSSGNKITYQWVETKAPKGEAITAPTDSSKFTANDSTTPDTDSNIPTPGTSLQDEATVETGITKVNATTTFGTMDLSGAEFTLEDSSGTPIKQSQGIDPQTGKQSNVALIKGAKYADDANGNIVLVTAKDGSTGLVTNIDLPNADGLTWVETKAPDAFAKNKNGADIKYAASNGVNVDTNNVMDDKDDKSTISNKPLLDAKLDKNSTNSEFNNKLGNAIYQAFEADGTPIKVNQGLNPDTGDAASIQVVTGSLASNNDGNLIVKANAQGQIEVKNMDGTKISKDITWKEVNPADGHALNETPVKESFDADTMTSDKTNLMASATTTDKPLGETATVKIDADTAGSTTQGDASLAGAEATLYKKTSDAGTTTVLGQSCAGTWVPVKQSQGVDPKTGESANVVLNDGATYASDADGNVVLVSDKTGKWGRVSNIDLTNVSSTDSNDLTYGWIETVAPYGYTRNTQLNIVTMSSSNDVDSSNNNYEDNVKLGTKIADRVVDVDFGFLKTITNNGNAGATGLNGAEFKLTPQGDTAKLLGQFDNGPKTNINGQDFFQDPTTGTPTAVTDPSQLHLGDTQTSQSYRNTDGSIGQGLVRFDHVPVGTYILSETKTPDGYQPVENIKVTILPGDQKPSPSSYELKAVGVDSGKVYIDQSFKVSYDDSGKGTITDDPTASTINLLNDDNFLGYFKLSDNLNDTPTPVIKTTASDTSDGDKTLGVGKAEGTDDSQIGYLPKGDYTMVTKWVKQSDGTQVATSQKDFTSLGTNSDSVTTTTDIDTTALENSSVTAEEFVYHKGDTSGTPVVSETNYKTNPDQTLTVEQPTGATEVKNPTVALTGETVVVPDHYVGGGYVPGTKVKVTISEAYSKKLAKTVPVSGSATFTADGSGKIEGDIPVTVSVKDYNDDDLTFYEKASIGDLVTVDNHNPNTPKETITIPKPQPKIDTEKTDGSLGAPGAGMNTDKDNNDGTNDRDTADTALVVQPGQSTNIYFNNTNVGNEAEKDLVFDDTTTSGPGTVQNITLKYVSADGKTTYAVHPDGKTNYLVDDKGVGVILQVGDHIQGQGILPPLPAGEIHEDQDTITGTGVISGIKVSDKDKWHGKTPKPQPHKYDLKTPNAGAGITSNALLNDDKEIATNPAFGLTGDASKSTTQENDGTFTQEVANTAKAPSVDKTDNNSANNNNKLNVYHGQSYAFELWWDLSQETDQAKLQQSGMVEYLDLDNLTTDTSKWTVTGATDGKAVDKSLYTITTGKKITDSKDPNYGKTPITIQFNATKTVKNTKGDEVKIIDTSKVKMGQYYKVDFSVTVKDDVKSGIEIKNVAKQTQTDIDGNTFKQNTETREKSSDCSNNQNQGPYGQWGSSA